MGVYRAPENPILSPADVKPSRGDFEVVGVFNAGVARLGEEVILLLRVAEKPVVRAADVVLCPIYDVGADTIIVRPFARDDPSNDFSDPRLIIRPNEIYLTSLSHLRLARSTDGVHFRIAETPALGPAREYETFGIEDPRLTHLNGHFYLDYVAVSPLGVTTCLASTQDFESFERHGVIFHPDNKDVALFPAPIAGCWGNHRHLLGTREGLWDETRIGAGAPPVRIEAGWLELYHGADRHNRYCLGAVLLDAERPWEILARSERPLFEPETDYERAGFFGEVVFTCGLLLEDDRLKIYYGAADTSICYAEIPLPDVYENLRL
jgi:predicted GH43/DUF377 family glycosyl hydrolase